MKTAAYLLAQIALSVLASANLASASTVNVSPISATAPNSNGINDLDIGNTIDRSGLFNPFVPGVTDFDSYIASDPVHNAVAASNEWFSAPQGSLNYTRYTLEFDLGQVYSVDRMAYWNEEYAGIGGFELRASTDGTVFSSLGTFAPTDNPGTTSSNRAVVEGFSYLPDVFTFERTDMRYFQIYTTSRCPVGSSLGYWGCSLGEVAVGAQVAAVPVPATLPLLASVVGAIGFVGRRKCVKSPGERNTNTTARAAIPHP